MAIIRTSSKSLRKKKTSPEKKALAKSWEELIQKWGPVSKKLPEKDLGQSKLVKSLQAQLVGRSSSRPGSLATMASHTGKSLPVKYKGEFAQREALAQAEIERKKKRVAIPFNKGPYQYITEGMDPKTFGKK